MITSCETCGCGILSHERFCPTCIADDKLQNEIMEEHGKPKLGGKRIDIVKEPTEKAKRFDDNKPMLQYNLLGKEVCELEAAVWAAGAEKYSPGNWLKGQSTTRAAGSLLRHLTAYLAGEDNDPESGLPHIGHVITSAKILANGQLKGFDDRAKS